jgi:hypothetical protein
VDDLELRIPDLLAACLDLTVLVREGAIVSTSCVGLVEVLYCNRMEVVIDYLDEIILSRPLARQGASIFNLANHISNLVHFKTVPHYTPYWEARLSYHWRGVSVH